jgi:hypothetical protein
MLEGKLSGLNSASVVLRDFHPWCGLPTVWISEPVPVTSELTSGLPMLSVNTSCAAIVDLQLFLWPSGRGCSFATEQFTRCKTIKERMCVCEETVGGSRRERDLPVTRSGQKVSVTQLALVREVRTLSSPFGQAVNQSFEAN